VLLEQRKLGAQPTLIPLAMTAAMLGDREAVTAAPARTHLHLSVAVESPVVHVG